MDGVCECSVRGDYLYTCLYYSEWKDENDSLQSYLIDELKVHATNYFQRKKKTMKANNVGIVCSAPKSLYFAGVQAESQITQIHIFGIPFVGRTSDYLGI